MTQNPSVNDPSRKAALDAALQQVDKQFGKGSIMKLGSKEKVDVPSISSGCLSLDLAIGMGAHSGIN